MLSQILGFILNSSPSLFLHVQLKTTNLDPNLSVDLTLLPLELTTPTPT